MNRFRKSPFFRILLVCGIPYSVLTGLWYAFAEPPFYYLIFWTFVLGFLYAIFLIGVLWLWTRLFRRSDTAIIFLLLVSAIIGAVFSPTLMWYSNYVITYGHWEKLELNIPEPISFFCLDQDDADRSSNTDVFYIDTKIGQMFKVIYNKGGKVIYGVKVMPVPIPTINKGICLQNNREVNPPFPPGKAVSTLVDCLYVSESGSCTKFILLDDGSIWQWTGSSLWPLYFIAGFAHIILGLITGVASSWIISLTKNQSSWQKPQKITVDNQ